MKKSEKKATPPGIEPTSRVVCDVIHWFLSVFLSWTSFLIRWSSEHGTLFGFCEISHISSIDRDHSEGNRLENTKDFWHFKLSTIRGRKRFVHNMAPFLVRTVSRVGLFWCGRISDVGPNSAGLKFQSPRLITLCRCGGWRNFAWDRV